MLPWQQSKRKSLLPRPHETRPKDGRRARSSVISSDGTKGVIFIFSSCIYTPAPEESQQVVYATKKTGKIYIFPVLYFRTQNASQALTEVKRLRVYECFYHESCLFRSHLALNTVHDL